MRNLVVAMTGASGSVYAVRLVEVLIAAGRTVHLTISPAAVDVLHQELGVSLDLDQFDPHKLLPGVDQIAHDSKLKLLKPSGGAGYAASSVFSDSEIFTGKIVYHHYRDFSGGNRQWVVSDDRNGVDLCPCSMGTLASIATGQSQNLILSTLTDRRFERTAQVNCRPARNTSQCDCAR